MNKSSSDTLLLLTSLLDNLRELGTDISSVAVVSTCNGELSTSIFDVVDGI
jgi:hypothetical protein